MHNHIYLAKFLYLQNKGVEYQKIWSPKNLTLLNFKRSRNHIGFCLQAEYRLKIIINNNYLKIVVEPLLLKSLE